MTTAFTIKILFNILHIIIIFSCLELITNSNAGGETLNKRFGLNLNPNIENTDFFKTDTFFKPFTCI